MDILEQIEVKTTNNNGDHDKFSHYVRKEAQMDGLLRISPAVALCGKTWYPDDIDVKPETFTVCPKCKEIYETIKQ